MAKDKDKKKGKKDKQKQKLAAAVENSAAPGEQDAVKAAAEEAHPKLNRKEFEKEMEKLQVELVKLQEWVKFSGAKICVLFEGRDTAGKGGVIKRITERVSPRVFRVVALSAPTEREKSQMYVQRYMPYLPAAGEVVLFDRSWYNRAGVERVMGFATPEQVDNFLKYTPFFERLVINSGVILIKYWLEVDMEEQAKRFQERNEDYRKILETQPDGRAGAGALVRLLPRPRCHVRRYRHPRKSLVCGAVQRPTQGALELHHTLLKLDPV